MHRYHNKITKYPGTYGIKFAILKEIRENEVKTGEYPPIIKFKTYREVQLEKGLKEFTFMNQTSEVKVIALNIKNAMRKYKNLINK